MSRINAKERGLLKGAVRRVFSRSELRRQVIDASIIIGYSDSNRRKVKTWCKCADCQTPTPKSYMACDHVLPVIPVDRTLEGMSWDELIEERLWCDISNLQALCPDCHKRKSKDENKQRRLLRKAKGPK